jgi:hypothetical protein
MNELEWLTDRRPDTPAPDDETTAHARAALLAHAVGETGPARDAAPRSSRHRAAPARRPRKAPLYTLAAAVFAIAIVVVAGALPSGDGPTRRIGAPVVAEAAPLVKLSNRIAAEPAPTGDATLVKREQHYPDRETTTGNDLYFDDGRYFYGDTLEQLKQFGADLGEGIPMQQREAAEAAVDLPPDQARQRFYDSTWPGGHEPATQPAAAADPATRRKLAAAKAKRRPISRLSMVNNRIWMASMDTLIAGAGDARVRAGVMKLMATIPAVKLEDHGATLDLRNTDFGDGYEETLTVDAKTGVIRKMTGGYPGKTPSVVVTYDIERVTARDILGS